MAAVIYCFIATIFILIYVNRRKNISAYGPYGFYIIYQLIYNTIPWLAQLFEVNIFSLSDQTDLLNIQLAIASLCNIAFASIYWLFWETPVNREIKREQYRIRPQFLFYIFYFPALILAYYFGWNRVTSALQTDGGLGGIYSLTAFMKLFLVAIYIHCLKRNGLGFYNLRILLLLVILLFVDGARTNFMMVISIVLYHFDHGRARRLTWSQAGTGITVALIFVLSRAVRLKSDIFQDIIGTFLAEGVFGSYMNLQTIFILKTNPSFHYTLGQNYVIDPIISLLPLGGFVENSLTVWVAKAGPMLIESYAPVGGFYYMAEALSSFGWVGPIVITSIYAALNNFLNIRSTKYQDIYLIYLATFGCLFVKTQFINCFKLFIVLLLFFIGSRSLLTLKNIVYDKLEKAH